MEVLCQSPSNFLSSIVKPFLQLRTFSNAQHNLAALLAPFCLTNHCSQQSVKSSVLSLLTNFATRLDFSLLLTSLMATVPWHRNQWPMPRRDFIFTSKTLLFSNCPFGNPYPSCSKNIFSFRNLHQKHRHAVINRTARSSYSISSSQSEQATSTMFKLYNFIHNVAIFSLLLLHRHFSNTNRQLSCTVENRLLVLNLQVN